MSTSAITGRLLALGLLGLLGAGCAQTLPGRQLAAARQASPAPAKLELASLQEHQPDTLQELLDSAVKDHPDLRAAHARVEAARGRMIQAGLYPNPSFGPNFSQLGDSANRLGEPGARLIQTIVTGGKLRIAKAAAAHGVQAADWQAITKWHEVVTRVRFAYFELLTALREQERMQDIGGVSKKALDTAATLEKAGVGNPPDVLRATVEFEQNRLKTEVSKLRVEAAERNLRTALGRPSATVIPIVKDHRELDYTPPAYDWQAMLVCLHENSAELQEARALIAQQEKLVVKAQKDVIPNITVTAVPFYESPNRELRGEIIVTAPIPIFDRNQGNIHTAKADLARTHAEEQQLELRLTDRLTAAYQRYQTARRQNEVYQSIIVPKARQSLELVEAAYAGGDKKYDYTALLQAQQVRFQAELAHTQATGELWRAVVEIAGILQQDRLRTGCTSTTSHK